MTDTEETTAPLPSEIVPWPVAFIEHCIIAIVGSMLLGSLPEAFVGLIYYNTGFEPYSPMIATAAFVLGYFVPGRILNRRAATFVWIFGVAWMVFGIYDTTRHWSTSWSPEKTAWSYALAHLFGPTTKCSGSECLGELFFTTPFAASITYSVGAYLRWRKHPDS